MKAFKANVIVGKGKYERERILHIRQENIIDALEITRKVQAKKINYLIEISNTDYLRGVAKA